MTRARIWTTALLLAAGAAVSTGCVSQESQDDLRNINRRLEEMRIEDQQRIAELEAEIARLRGQIQSYESLRAKSAADQQTIAELRAQMAALEAQLAEANSRPEQITIVEGPLPQQLRDALRDLAAANPELMEFDEARGMIRLRSDLTFALGSTSVNDNAKAALTRLAGVLNSAEARAFDIQVVGHTDNVPVNNPANKQKYEDNWGLSAFRSISVMRILKDSGINQGRILVAGRGETQPIEPNGARGSQANRRVEIFIVKSSNPAPAAGGGAQAPAVQPAPPRGTTARPGVVEDRPAVEDPGAFK